MIADLPPNFTTRPYRGLSVQEVDIVLTESAILDLLIGREVYRRTDFLLLERAGAMALVAVEKASTDPLFSPVVEARVLALPDQIAILHSPHTDVGNASALAEAVVPHQREGVVAYVVRGLFEHINFIWRPEPVVVRVTEVVPPRPPKLLMMAQQALAFDEDLPPMRLELDEVDIDVLTSIAPGDTYLLPCRGSGADVGSDRVAYLDTRPEERLPWIMVGCERSEQFHEHFYGDRAPRLDICPRRRDCASYDGRDATGVDRRAEVLTLTKCCLIERGVAVEDGRAIVPWGANLDEVRHALRLLAGLGAARGAAMIEDTPWPGAVAVHEESPA